MYRKYMSKNNNNHFKDYFFYRHELNIIQYYIYKKLLWFILLCTILICINIKIEIINLNNQKIGLIRVKRLIKTAWTFVCQQGTSSWILQTGHQLMKITKKNCKAYKLSFYQGTNI